MKRSWTLVLLALGALGCGSKENISLNASVSEVELSVSQTALVTQLTGGFNLHLEVGAQADGDAQVELESFSLIRDAATLVGGLQVVPQGVTFPLTVGKGQRKSVPFTLDQEVAASEKANLCAGPLQLSGAVKHNLHGGETKPFTGKPALPSGC